MARKTKILRTGIDLPEERLVVVRLHGRRCSPARIVRNQRSRGGARYLQRKQGKLASGELLAPDRVRVRDLFQLLLEDYDVRAWRRHTSPP